MGKAMKKVGNSLSPKHFSSLTCEHTTRKCMTHYMTKSQNTMISNHFVTLCIDLYSLKAIGNAWGNAPRRDVMSIEAKMMEKFVIFSFWTQKEPYAPFTPSTSQQE